MKHVCASTAGNPLRHAAPATACRQSRCGAEAVWRTLNFIVDSRAVTGVQIDSATINSLVVGGWSVARKKSANLTDAELRLMDVVWEKGEATVSEVAEALPHELGLAYNTVLTTLRILEEKGFLRHTKAKEGRAFVYRAVVDREQASRTAVRHLVSRFFRNSPELLVLNLLEDEELSRKELRRIHALLAGEEK